MTYHEGILISKNTNVNAAAIGADIEPPVIESKVYRPSDTARNLEQGVQFTFSLTEDPSLFFRAALNGHDEPQTQEIDHSDLIVEDDFIYPKDVEAVYFCEVERVSINSVRDRYGSSELKEIEGQILKTIGKEEKGLGRGEPLIDALVHASRIYVADEKQKKQLRKKIETILKDERSLLKKKIIDFVEEHMDEV